MANASLSGKAAIVTGGSRGNGAGIALELARHGAKVAITFTSPSSEAATNELIASIKELNNGSAAVGIRADLRQLESPELIVRETISAFSSPASGSTSTSTAKIDILVNNAGCECIKKLGDLTPEDFANVYDLNIRAVVFLTQAVLPHLHAPGRIINIGSVGARAGLPAVSLYGSSKAALGGLTWSWAVELGAVGTTVNVVDPGPVDTNMMGKIPKATVEKQKSMTPVENRVGTVDDVAQIVAFLWRGGESLGFRPENMRQRRSGHVLSRTSFKLSSDSHTLSPNYTLT